MDENHILPFLWMRGEQEAVLREEMEKIHACGIGAVCLEARPHEEFCREGWWHDVDIIMDEAKKRGMKIWILDDKHFPTGYANGLIAEKYPERKKWYINHSKVNVAGFPGRRLTIELGRMLKPAIGFWEIEQSFAGMEARKSNCLLAIIAVQVKEGSYLKNEIIDLTDTAEGEFATFTLPEGMWSVFVIFKTQTDGGDDTYINMIDRASAHTQIEGVYEAHYARYADEFGKTILGFFSDEPQFGNLREVCYDAKLGKKKMPLPWSDELEEILRGIYGGSYVKYLPFLFQEGDKAVQHRIRYDYMNAVSQLYQKNFSEVIGSWCEEHGVEYIGHVVEDSGCHSRLGMGAAHYFRALSGQHMAGIDVIGEQVVFGAPVHERQGIGGIGGDGEFYHYALGKLGASCGHLDPKKKGRTLCELFGAYGWGFGVRDMKYVLEHLLVRGINELVPHAFSMAEYPDADCPPHFYARGNHPQFPMFAYLMKYANRMCALLSGGTHAASVAVLYDAEADWVDDAMPMQKVCRELMEHQIDFDIISTDMLSDLQAFNGSFDGKRLLVNGVVFDALIVPQMKTVPEAFYEFAVKRGEFPVIFVNEYPEEVIYGDAAMAEQLTGCDRCALSGLGAEIQRRGIKRIEVDTPFAQLSFYHYKKERSLFVFLNESPNEAFCGNVTLPVEGEVICYDGFRDLYWSMDCRRLEGSVTVALELAPGECIVLLERGDECVEDEYQTLRQQLEGTTSVDLSEGWKVTLSRAAADPQVEEELHMETLTAVSDLRPAFSGIIRYSRNLSIDTIPNEAYLRAEQVYESMEVFVNGKSAGVRIAPPYLINIADYLKLGKNKLTVKVYTTPAREQLTCERPPFDFSYDALEATGMYKTVELMIK